MEKLKLKDTFLNGIVKSNPVFVLVLGMCPVLAMSTNLIQAFAMGVATMLVLFCSNILISLLRNVIPARVRMPSYIIIFSTFVIAIQLIMRKFLPDLYSQMRAFIALIVVNCIIFARAESFASCNKVKDSALDALATGTGFVLAISLLGAVRELLSSGSLAGYTLFSFVSRKAPSFSYYAGTVLAVLGICALAAAVVISFMQQLKAKTAVVIVTLLICGFSAILLGAILAGLYPKMAASAAKPFGFIVLAIIMAVINYLRSRSKTGGEQK